MGNALADLAADTAAAMAQPDAQTIQEYSHWGSAAELVARRLAYVELSRARLVPRTGNGLLAVGHLGLWAAPQSIAEFPHVWGRSSRSAARGGVQPQPLPLQGRDSAQLPRHAALGVVLQR